LVAYIFSKCDETTGGQAKQRVCKGSGSGRTKNMRWKIVLKPAPREWPCIWKPFSWYRDAKEVSF